MSSTPGGGKTQVTLSAPRRMAVRVASMLTLPPPMTTTRLPVKSGALSSPQLRSNSTAESTFSLSSPSRPSFLSAWAPMAT